MDKATRRPGKRGRKKGIPDVAAAVAVAEQQITQGSVTTIGKLRKTLRFPNDKKFWREVYRALLKKSLAQAPKRKGGRWHIIPPAFVQEKQKKKDRLPPRALALPGKVRWIAENIFENGSQHAAILQEAAREIRTLRRTEKIIVKHTREWKRQGFLRDKKQKGA